MELFISKIKEREPRSFFNSISEKSPASAGGERNRYYVISQLPLGCNRFSFDNGHCLYVFPGCDT